MGVGEDPVGEDGMDIDAPAWPPAGVEAADEGVIREGDPGDFYMKVIAKKFRGGWQYGVITGVVTEWVLEDYDGATQWRAVFEDGDTVDLLRLEVVEAMAAAQEHPPVDADGEARLVTVPEGDDQSSEFEEEGWEGGGDAAGAGWTSDEEEEEEEAHLRAWESAAVPGCETNALTFAVMKCSAQVKSKNSNNSADSEWQLLHDIMPAGFTWGGMAVPRSHKAMRKFPRVPDTSRYDRHMCPKGFIRMPQSLKLTAARVWYVLSVADIIKGWFRDPVWYACWKKGTDVSINAFRASSEAERLNEGGHGTGLAAGDFLHADTGIYTLTDDGFLSHLRTTQSVTGIGISRVECPDGTMKVAPPGYAKDVLQRVDGVELQAVRTSASCLLLSHDQVLEQIGVIGQLEEDLARSDLDGDEDGEVSLAARRAFNTTRLEQTKQNTGCHGVCQVHVVLGYVCMVNLFPLAPDHLCFLGLGKDFWRNFLDVLGHVGLRAMKQEDRRKALVMIPSNFGRGLRPSFAVSKKSKGKPPPPPPWAWAWAEVGVGVGVGVIAFPFMTAGSGKVTVQSGWVIEDCWHHTESFSLLTAGPLFEEARVKAIMTGKELASPAVMRAVSQQGVLGHMYKRMQGAVWFVTRWGLQSVVTDEDGPERKAQVDALAREERTRYLADITVYARLAEGNGFVSLLVSNLHSAVCRMIHRMLACGHPLAELWMENLMGFLKAGAKPLAL
eukprot:jgi/Tetstr1/443947/TSEL_031898.t1